jgi:hypothetical protein
MDAALAAHARAIANPFVSNRVDSAWDRDAVDVEAINRTAFQRCSETIDLVHSTGQCRGLLLAGEPGSGKTHLLQRLRRHVQEQGGDCFVYIPPVSGPDRFFRDLLQHTVQDLVGSRTGSASSQLERILVRELLKFETRERVSAAAFWADVRARHAPGEALFGWLETPMQRLCERLEVDPDVIRVLRHYLGVHHRFDAYAWLLGRSVPDPALERLGVGRTLEDDADAFLALIALSRLAGARSVLVLAFDQLEGLQVTADDREGLQAFAAGIARLFVECRNIATISCVQTYFMQDLERAVPPAHMQRLAQDQGALTPLNRAAALELVAQRLAASPELAEIKAAAREADPIWPLARDQIENSISVEVPARRLLDVCRDLFETWRRGEAATPPVPKASLDELWQTRTEQATTLAPDEGVLADGLLKLFDARSPGKCRRGGARDGVDLVVSGRTGEVGVAVCHAENMTSLAARLRRLQAVAGSGRFKRLVLIRDERLPISATAKTTRERLNALEQAGHPMLRPPAEAYAAIAAARQLLAEAAAGDLSLDGKPVAPEDLKAWLAGNLSAVAAEVLDAIDGAAGRHADELVERIQEVLDGVWIAQASDIAARVGVEEAALLDRLATQQRAIGVLTGAPAVVFLRPEGLRPL